MTRTQSGVFRAVIALALVLPSAARAEDVSAKLDRLDDDTKKLVARADDVQKQLQPGHGFITESEAVHRFEDNLYEFMVGDYQKSAEGFFALVTTGALGEVGMHRDAEWYLAESLFQMGNYDTAETRFQVIADDAQHPFHDDAVRRLLELYATSGQTDKFRAAYQAQIVSGHVKPSDLITYSIGKAFYQQSQADRNPADHDRDLVQAKSNLGEIQKTSPLYGKAQYVLGVIAVVEGDLDQAQASFSNVLDLSVNTSEDRQVLDLSLLALGRLNYESGDFVKATDYYNRIGGDSPYLADKLYEIVWTYIKQASKEKDPVAASGQYQKALDACDIFLLAFPEHQYAAQLKLLEGHLHMKIAEKAVDSKNGVSKSEFDSALTNYESVIADYTPIQERFDQLAHDTTTDPEQYFQKIAAIQSGDTSEVSDLPPYAVSMMTTDPDLSKALAVYRELVRQQDTVSASEQLISELDTALASGQGIGGFHRLRGEVSMVRALSLQDRLDVLRVEDEWLWATSPAPGRPHLQELRHQRDLAVQQCASYATEHKDDPDSAPCSEEGYATLASVEQAYSQARSASNDENKGAVGGRIDGLSKALQQIDGQLGTVGPKIGEIEAAEVQRIKERLTYETDQVAQQHTDLDTTKTQAETVSVGLTRAGFARLEGFFADSVLHADMGVVDVYWDQKVAVDDQRTAMVERKNELMNELEQRFDVIRQKLPPPTAAPAKPAEGDEQGASASGSNGNTP